MMDQRSGHVSTPPLQDIDTYTDTREYLRHSREHADLCVRIDKIEVVALTPRGVVQDRVHAFVVHRCLTVRRFGGSSYMISCVTVRLG